MGAWILDFVTGWAGEWGFVAHSVAEYRNPAFTGDATFVSGEVVETRRERRRNVATVRVELRNQDDARLAKATVEVELPDGDGG
jgi:acyl dehydratase